MSKVPVCRTCDDSKFIEACGRRIPCRDCAAAAQMKVDQERYRTNARLMDPVALDAENKILRRLLWTAYSQGRGYGDDGEMQFEGIDFKRMTIEEIQTAITRRGVKAIDDYINSPEGRRWLEVNSWLVKKVET